MTASRPFRVLCADPPWKFSDRVARPGKGRGASNHYKTLTVQQLMAFPQPRMAEDALLFLWRVAAMTSEAMDVARAWGFVPKAEIVWVKTRPSAREPMRLNIGMGRYTRGSHEVAMICARGKGHKVIRDHSIPSVFYAPVGEHSAKPGAFYDMVEDLARGPYVELFARRPREKWVQFGDQLPGAEAHP